MMPGERALRTASASRPVASPVSSRIQAVAPTADSAGSCRSGPARRRSWDRTWSRPSWGSVMLRIHSHRDASVSRPPGPPGPPGSPGGGPLPGPSRWRSTRRTISRSAPLPDRCATVAAWASASQATARIPGGASSATDSSVDSAAAGWFDQIRAQPIRSRAAKRRSGSVVTDRACSASSCTQSACPAVRASAAAASSRRPCWSRSGLSSAARASARAAAATPPRRWVSAADCSSSDATCSSGFRAAAARCQA